MDSDARKAWQPENQRAMSQHHGAAWERLGRELPASPAVVATRAQSGALSLILPPARSLHSRVDPVQEAAGLAERARLAEAETVFVFGLGAGHLLVAALATAGPETAVHLLLLDPASLHVTLAERDLSAALADPRLTLHVGDLREIAAAMPRQTTGLRVLVLPALLAAASPELGPFADMARELWAGQCSRETQRSVLLENLEGNLPAILDAEPLEALAPELAGRPALVVGPGPSLLGQLEALRAAAERPPLLALDTALRALGEAGLRPDLVCTVDPTPLNLRKLDGIELDAPLLFVGSARPEFVAASPRPIYACERDGLLDRAHPLFGRAGRIESGGSVLLAALDALLQLGVSSVGLVGTDLALSGERVYAAGEASVGAHRLREVEALDGGTLQTTEVFWRHRRRLLRRAHEAAGRVVDLRPAGATLPGVPREELEGFLEQGSGCAIARQAAPDARTLRHAADANEAEKAARAALRAALDLS